MNIISIGIDPSLTSTAIVVLKGCDVIECRTLPNKSSLHLVPRVALILDEITKSINKHRKSNKDCKLVVAIEGFSYGSKGRSVFDIGYLGFRIREDLMELSTKLNFECVVIPPSNLKQYATGKGNSKKEIVMMNVFKRWGEEFEDNNEADAYVLARMGRTYMIEGEELTDFQIKSMEKIRKVDVK